MKIKRRSPLSKKAAKGHRGYPMATVAFYGPDDTRASKVAVGIVHGEDEGPVEMERWFSDDSDLRRDHRIHREILAFIKEHRARTVAMADRIIGCPHEEGKDYPDGEVCPECPFWAERDRWTGEQLSEQ